MEELLLSPHELNAMMAQRQPVALLDTREPRQYAEAHIPGAVNVPVISNYLATSDEVGVKALRNKFAAVFGVVGLSGIETAVLYEQSMDSGHGQSCRGYLLLKYLGYPAVMILNGGISAWVAAGLPVTDEVFLAREVHFPIFDTGTDVVIGRNEMLQALDRPEVIKLDVRDVEEWLGRSSSPYGKDFCPRKGRIPGARWIEWYRMMKPSPAGPVFKDPEEVRAECHTAGFSADSPVYVYCFKGSRASNTLVALKNAGFKDVRVYFGSW